MSDEEKTAKAGAEPADKGQEPDSPTGEEKETKEATADSSPEVEMDKDGKPLPWNQQSKWKSARQAEKKLNELLKANDLEDPDDLIELVNSGKVVKGKLTDLNQLDELTAKAAKLDKYEAYWKEQEEQKRRADEYPEQTIARLEKELKQKENAEKNKEAQHREAEAAKQAINSFEREVTGLIQEKEIPKEQQGFVLKFFGVGNQANEIDITDRKAIKKLIQDGIKDKEAYDQAIIKAYREGKINIPKIGTATTAPMGEKPKIMLKDARKALLEAMQRVIPGG